MCGLFAFSPRGARNDGLSLFLVSPKSRRAWLNENVKVFW